MPTHVPPKLPLVLLRHRLAVVRLPADARVPAWATGSPVLSAVVRTPEELSILTTTDHVPAEAQAESGYRAFKVRGPLPFDLIGVFASMVQPLAESRVSIFALSTYDTDYVLVKEGDLETALLVMRRVGHTVEEEPLPVRAGDADAGAPHVGH